MLTRLFTFFLLLSLLSCSQVLDTTNNSNDSGNTKNDDGGNSSGETGNGTNDPTDEPTTLSPVLFGFWGLNGFLSDTTGATLTNDVMIPFNATIFQVSAEASHYTVSTLLPLLDETGMKVTMRLIDDDSTHTGISSGGNFDLQKWKDKIDLWDVDDPSNTGHTYAEELTSFIGETGTLVGHMILDDIANFSYNTPGALDPTGEELDEMACYSDSIFGDSLMTFVRQRCDLVPMRADGLPFECLDACVNQYTNYSEYSDGEVNSYAATVSQAASDRGLQVINGLNIADGGDGSSGQTGTTLGHYAMSAQEITDYGTVLLDRTLFPDLQIFLMWKYDGTHDWNYNTVPLNDPTAVSTYFNGTDSLNDVQGALFDLGTSAANPN